MNQPFLVPRINYVSLLRKKQLAYSQGSKIDQILSHKRVSIMYMQVSPRLQRGVSTFVH